MQIQRRALLNSKWNGGIHPVLQRVYAGRGITGPDAIERNLARLLSPVSLGGIDQAVEILIREIGLDAKIVVAGDYDCDGATGTAVAVRGLRLLGAKHVSFTIPDRLTQGYGLSPALVESMQPKPDVIVTVDSGVASIEGVRTAKEKGIVVIVTDHHLPGEVLPQADAIVNPNLQGDAFPSKSLAGVGVMFYLLIAIRAEMRSRKLFKDNGPDLSCLLDLVALGTVADMVPLDQNNRILVEAGLRRIRSGKAHVGINALVSAGGRRLDSIIASDIGFGIAPRLNAAGRLENMKLGVETLLTDDPIQATEYVAKLDTINKERRDLQARMTAEAEEMVTTVETDASVGVVVFNAKWHSGVVGLVASKLKETLHRPVIAFAPGGEDSKEVRGSGRSIDGFHLRDALARIDVANPGLILKFGGHAMAAGLSILARDIPTFTRLFDKEASASLSEEQLSAVILSDGELNTEELDLSTARALIDGGPWGQGFPEPQFDGVFECVDWRVLKDKHLHLMLRDARTNTIYPAIAFFAFSGKEPPSLMRVVYQLTVERWRDSEFLKLMVRHIEKVG